MNNLDLKINYAKSFVLVAGSKQQRQPRLYIEGLKLEVVDSFNYLGIMFDRDNNWKNMATNRGLLMEKILGLFLNL